MENNTQYNDLSDVFAGVESSSQGLSSAEAQARLIKFGPNQLPPSPPKPWWRRFLDQFRNPLIAILVLAAFLSWLLGYPVDSAVIWAVILINTILGFVQEYRAENAVAALQSLLDPHVSVLRDGRWETLPAARIVPGDLLAVQAGERISADLALVEAARELAMDESMLSGESLPVPKAAMPRQHRAAAGAAEETQRQSMIYAGTLVTTGSGLGIVLRTGATTTIGRIQTLMTSLPPVETPLLRRVNRLAGSLSVAVLVLAALALAVGLSHGQGLENTLLAAVSLAVAIIPEGLPAVISITLALGVQRMARRGAILRQLPAVETLGSVTVICTDKTGTLTENRMQVATALLAESTIHAPFTVSSPQDREALAKLATAAVLCNDAHLGEQGEGLGDPMEQALLHFAHHLGLISTAIRETHPRRDTLPFQHERKFMATTHDEGRVFLKGAPEVILDLCAWEWHPHGLEAIDRKTWRERIDVLAEDGMRTLALAYGRSPEGSWENPAQGGWTLLGTVAFLDPPRPGVREAIQRCLAAGIRMQMITGDHPRTAAAIARQLGFMAPGDPVVTHGQWTAAPPAERLHLAATTKVFARVNPEDKLQLVETLQQQGEIVAMTGDGVNDAPALRRADIGVAMGRSGSDVAREAAAMVLSDDHFAHIVDAVAEGRRVYANIRKTLQFMLVTSFAQGLVVLLAVLVDTEMPITPLQILWVNTLTASTMALVFAFMGRDPGLMQQAPRPPQEALIPPALWRRMATFTALTVTVVFLTFHYGLLDHTQIQARTLAVDTLMTMEAALLIALYGRPRQDRGDAAAGLALLLCLVSQYLFGALPGLQRLFTTSNPDRADLFILLGAGILSYGAARILWGTDPIAASAKEASQKADGKTP
ncbi:Lead, cadmium, zinc and mercury transporting ATPase Copper-translocating P-type ATPase [Desulfurella amilsii]|uniref:Lead, cadmium, zinc and mercury transporting ATPase Copper-translocating P-type ATPase n=1 Tax=Desulfurella amilsii TaxID=1562698 RepID=A0A1X4XWK8_9BACT|nr:HAD-IC family P-type ATPase [Desulfurella amilsii]OSS41917.1 Lead, cadmium, zinc and mercury transporting ATPase Copper-translocating P-type ATPase [Desulfurella amilsii]